MIEPSAARASGDGRRERIFLKSGPLQIDKAPVSMLDHLSRWARERPSGIFLASRSGDAWSECSYCEAFRRVTAVSRRLLRLGALPGQTLLIVSSNSIDAAILGLAAMRVGLAIAPVSPTWTRDPVGHAKLHRAIELIEPRFAWFEPGLDATLAHPHELLVGLDCAREHDRGHEDFEDADIAALVTPQTVAKILFTSGSTGMPKGVIHTHRMLTAQQEQMAQLWSFLDDHPPILCDWLPWNHTSGGNNSFNMVLRNGGTLHIDDGLPTRELIGRSAVNLAAVRPTWHTNVPLGYSMLLPVLESDLDLAAAFFERLDLMVYGGASLSCEIWERFNSLFRRVRGRDAPWASGWGLTETTSTIAITPSPVRRAGLVGIPLPGVEMRLDPCREGYLAHVRGPNITPGYWRDASATARAFDRDGFFCTGDVVRLADPADPGMGLEFLGRAAEEFKLATGSWVLPGKVRLDLMRLAGPLVADVVVAGPQQDFLTAFVWLNDGERTSKALRGNSPSPDSQVAAALLRAVDQYHALNPGATHRLRRLCLLAVEPSGRNGELTEKGSINQGRFLSNRGALVQAVYQRARLSSDTTCVCEFESKIDESP